jgi:hypothetical protein
MALQLQQKHNLSASVMDDLAVLCGIVAVNSTVKARLSQPSADPAWADHTTIQDVKDCASEFMPYRSRTLLKKAAEVEQDLVRQSLAKRRRRLLCQGRCDGLDLPRAPTGWRAFSAHDALPEDVGVSFHPTTP